MGDGAMSGRVWAAGLGVVVLWASAFPAIRVASPELGVVGLSFIRLAVAATALCLLAWRTGAGRPTRRELPLITGCGLLGMTAYQVLLNGGELSVPAGTASMIVAAAALVSVAVAALVQYESLTRWQIAGSGTAILGVVLVCLSRSGLSLSAAVWLIVGAATVQGLYHPLTRPLLRVHTGLEVATDVMVAGTVTTAPRLSAGAGWPRRPWAAGCRLSTWACCPRR